MSDVDTPLIDMDRAEMERFLTLREKLAIHLLLIVFGLIVPAQYDHQVKKALQPVIDALWKRSA